MQKTTRNRFFALAGLLVTYAIACGLDRWTDSMRRLGSQLALPHYYLIAFSLANLVLAACGFALLAWALPVLGRGAWLAWHRLGCF